jgi:hypothetical protein
MQLHRSKLFYVADLVIRNQRLFLHFQPFVQMGKDRHF